MSHAPSNSSFQDRPISAPPRVVLCSGHMIDAPGRPVPRFPAAAEGDVRAAIDRWLSHWSIGAGDLAICGGARGADIVFAEACLARGAQVIVCLAHEAARFVQTSVRLESDASWERRFAALLKVATVRMPQASSTQGNAYTAANEHMLQEARRHPAARLLAVIVSDTSQSSDGPGGASHFEQLARDAGAEVAVIVPLRASESVP